MLADRMAYFDSSGIRKVFDLAAKMANPINLSIGQPDFDVPQTAREAASTALESRKNGYSVTQGTAALRDKLSARVAEQFGHADRPVLVTSGTSGGLVLAMLALVNPGDEVIVFDPYFVMYESLVRLAGGKLVLIDTYPDFQIDVDRVRQSITRRTKVILFNSPANPTGAMATDEATRDLALLAAEHGVTLISDEIYRLFSYDRPFRSPALFNDRTLVIDGFSKAYGMTGWRVGYAHGPAEIIQAMTRMQQYTFVCAPHPLQWGAAAALEADMTPHVDVYRGKRDRIVAGLAEDYELVIPGGAFYAFPRVPWGTADEFVAEALRRELLIIPGNIFSRRDTHFRISYAAPDDVLDRGIAALRELARRQ
ncbi:MAG TPA: aminotransferase class I/II-fold pyridoxal phosphate-dependent enzyme [Pirellulales bacterium]|jgi:aspartate aminotransferase/aminotransferase|nr:aminotransferase class I/II-fold pyridoxal phosphate-dependent enzyme [Pirellulales bacterium]